MNSKKQSPPLQKYAKVSSMVFQQLAIIGGGVWGGLTLDKYTKLNFPVFTLTLTLFAVGLATYFLYRSINQPDNN